MRHISATSWRFIDPVLENSVIKKRLKDIDNNFFVLSSAIALVASFVLWVNI